jgi:hypothetical protein
MSSLPQKHRLATLIKSQYCIRKYWNHYKKNPSITLRRQLRWSKNLNWDQSSVNRRIRLIYLYLLERNYSNLHGTPCVITDPRGTRVKGCSWYNVNSDRWCKSDNIKHIACYEI